MRHRTDEMFRRAERLSPSLEQLERNLYEAEIYDPQLHEIARELYKLEGLFPPVAPPLSDDPIPLARYQDELGAVSSANAQPDHYHRFREKLVWILEDYESEQDESGGGIFESQARA